MMQSVNLNLAMGGVNSPATLSSFADATVISIMSGDSRQLNLVGSSQGREVRGTHIGVAVYQVGSTRSRQRNFAPSSRQGDRHRECRQPKCFVFLTREGRWVANPFAPRP